MSSDLDKIQKMAGIITHQQNAIQMAQEHLSVLYTAQNFLVGVLIGASPELKAHLGTRLRQALADAEQMECSPHLLQTLQGWEARTRTQAALTPEQRCAQLRLVKTPKTVPLEDTDR